MSKQSVNDILKSLPNASKDIVSKIPDVNELANQAKSAISASPSADSILSSSLSSIASSFSTSASSLFSNTNKDTSPLSSIKSDILGKKETDSQIKSLASGTIDAIANPVSFITKSIDDSIKGIDTTVSGISELLNSNIVDNISKATGNAITSIGELTQSISSVTNELASQVSNITNQVTSSISNIGKTIAPVVSSISEFTGSLMSGIKSTINAVTSPVQQLLGSATSLTNAIKGANNQLLSILPGPLKDLVGGFTNKLISNTLDKYITNNVASLQNILNKLSGIADPNSLISYFSNLLGTNNLSSIQGLFGGNTADFINGLFGSASQVCSNITSTNVKNDKDMKDFYDILLQIAADSGLADLIKQLLSCTSTTDNNGKKSLPPLTYFDERSIELLQNTLPDVALRGDITTYEVIQDAIGAANVKSSKTDAITLNSNMLDDGTNMEKYEQVLEKFQYTGEDLLTTEIGDAKVIDGPVTVLMSSSNTTYVDKIIGEDNRLLIQGAMLMYS